MLYTHIFIALKLEGTSENPRNVDVMDELNKALGTIVLKPGEDVVVNAQVKLERLFP